MTKKGLCVLKYIFLLLFSLMLVGIMVATLNGATVQIKHSISYCRKRVSKLR
jgi:hypothetical protein